MNKTVLRYFIDFTGKQEMWLNKMAACGYRLVRCGKLIYTFEPCLPGEYQYCVEFTGEKSRRKHKDYKGFLEALGYRVLPKSINPNWSSGKLRLRPWADGAGKIAASPGVYNKELLIVEKRNDGKPFALHTDTEDLAAYFNILRNLYLWAAIMGMVAAAAPFAVSAFTAFDLAEGSPLPWCGIAALGVAGAVSLFFGAKYALIAKRYRELAQTNE